jgi:hypothetical protein
MSYIRKIQWLLVIVIVAALPTSARADAPVGQFNLQFLPAQGIWDVTGNYPTIAIDILTNNVDLIQDEEGKITGTGTGTGTEIVQGITIDVDLAYNITGLIKTVRYVTRVVLTLKISGTATDGFITLPLNGSIKLTLDLDRVNNILIGSWAGRLCVRGRCGRDRGPVQLDIPQTPQLMDGNWTLVLDLQSPDNKNIVGIGAATLSNGRVVPLTASGNYSATKLLTKLTLEGEGGILKLKNDASPTSHALGWIVTKAKVLGQKAITPDDLLSP